MQVRNIPDSLDLPKLRVTYNTDVEVIDALRGVVATGSGGSNAMVRLTFPVRLEHGGGMYTNPGNTFTTYPGWLRSGDFVEVCWGID